MTNLELLKLMKSTTNFSNYEQVLEYCVCSLTVKGFSSLQLSYCFLLSKSEIFEILERNGFVLLNTTHSLDMEWTEIGRNIYMTYSYLSGSISLSFLSKIFHLPEYDVNALINETVVMLKNNS